MEETNELNDTQMAGDTYEERAWRVRELFSTWEEYREATTPVRAAAALLDFANQFYHYRCELERTGEYLIDRDFSRAKHNLTAGDRVRFTFKDPGSGVETLIEGVVEEDEVACFISVSDEEGMIDAVNLKDIVEIL